MPRLAALAAAAVASAGLVWGGTSSSAAAADEPPDWSIGHCSVSAPARVVIEARLTRVTARLGADCVRDRVYRAEWDNVHRYHGPYDRLVFKQTATGEVPLTASIVLGDYYPMGTWDLEGAQASGFRPGGQVVWHTVRQNDVPMEVRLGSRVSLTSSRSGNQVTLRAAARRYTPEYHRYAYWKGKSVALQYRTSTGSWKTFKTARTSSTGVLTHRFTVSGKRSYRAVTADQSNSWGSTSNLVAR